jgi:hypothetical protein
VDLREQGHRVLGAAHAALHAGRDHARRLALGLVLIASAARANSLIDGFTGEAALRLDIDRAVDETNLSSHGRVAAGPEALVLGNALAASVRAQFGAGWNGGFLADMTLALGGGIHLGSEGYLVATIGAGFDGAGNLLRYTFHAPVTEQLEIDLGAHVRLRGWATMSWVTATSRRHGSPAVSPVFDEFESGLAVRFGNRVNEWRFSTGSGYLIGVEMRQALGGTYVGGVLAFELGGGGRE